jgi:hypothetical protein
MFMVAFGKGMKRGAGASTAGSPRGIMGRMREPIPLPRDYRSRLNRDRVAKERPQYDAQDCRPCQGTCLRPAPTSGLVDSFVLATRCAGTNQKRSAGRVSNFRSPSYCDSVRRLAQQLRLFACFRNALNAPGRGAREGTPLAIRTRPSSEAPRKQALKHRTVRLPEPMSVRRVSARIAGRAGSGSRALSTRARPPG